MVSEGDVESHKVDARVFVTPTCAYEKMSSTSDTSADLPAVRLVESSQGTKSLRCCYRTFVLLKFSRVLLRAVQAVKE